MFLLLRLTLQSKIPKLLTEDTVLCFFPSCNSTRKILTAADFTHVKGTSPALTNGLHRNMPVVKRQKIKGAFNHAKTLTGLLAQG